MISPDIYLERMLSIVQEAGGIALDLIQHSDPGLKKDHSIITLADKAISTLVRERLHDFLQDPQHILIDEEDGGSAEYLDQERLDRTSFIWALDPIDGTRLYANRMPLFGVSIGLIKDLKPWLGVVYFSRTMVFLPFLPAGAAMGLSTRMTNTRKSGPCIMGPGSWKNF